MHFFGEFPHIASPHSPKASSRKKVPALVGQSPRNQADNPPKPQHQVRIQRAIGQSPRNQTYNSPKPRHQVRIQRAIGQLPRQQSVNSPILRIQHRLKLCRYFIFNKQKTLLPTFTGSSVFLHEHKILIYYILLRYCRFSVRALHVCRLRRLHRRMRQESSLLAHFQQHVRQMQ